jgi:hypothetical protein
MSRFVILRHEVSPNSDRSTHWDFMLERAGVLRTWALEGVPAAGREINADALADHRLAYLDYEGPISGDRGCVSRWDQGEYEVLTEHPDELTVRIAGQRLIGTASLRRTDAESQRWIFGFST